jgi:hypothetical protein
MANLNIEGVFMKTKMRNTIGLILGSIGIVAIMALSGCAASSSSNDTGSSTQSDTDGTSSAATNATAASSSTQSSFNLNTTIEETVLVDTADIRIIANDIKFKYNNLYVDLTFENKSASKLSITSNTLGFSGNYINNYMIEEGWTSCDVEPGMTETDDLYFKIASLQSYGINDASEIGLGFLVKDASYNVVYKGVSSIPTSSHGMVPDGDAMEAFGNSLYQLTYGFTLESLSDKVIFDANGIQIDGQALVTTSQDERYLYLDASNNSGNDVYIKVKDVSINGIDLYDGTWTSDYALDSKKCLITICLDDIVSAASRSSDEDINIDLNNVKTVSFTIEATDDNYNTIVGSTEVALTF